MRENAKDNNSVAVDRRVREVVWTGNGLSVLVANVKEMPTPSSKSARTAP